MSSSKEKMETSQERMDTEELKKNAQRSADEALAKLSSWLSDAASENETVRTDAMAQLQQFQKSDWVGVWLMKLMISPSTSPIVVLAASIQLKNAVRDRWDKTEETDSEEEEEDDEEDEEDEDKKKNAKDWIAMSDNDRRCVSQNLIGLLLQPQNTAATRRQVGETIMMVAGVVPHERWLSFWSELGTRLRKSDIWTEHGDGETKIAILLECVASVLQDITTYGLDEEEVTDAIVAIREAAVHVGELLITILSETAGRLAACPPPSSGSSATSTWPPGPSARSLLRVMFLCTYALCTFNTLEMVSCMENKLGNIFSPLAALFALPPITVPAVDQNDRGWNVAAIASLEELRCEICDLGTLFASKYPSEFAPFLITFTRTVWESVVHIHSSLSDDLASSTIAFLTIALSRGAAPVGGNATLSPEVAVLTLSGRAAPVGGWAVGALNVDTITQVLNGVVIPQLVRRAIKMEEVAKRIDAEGDDDVLDDWGAEADLIDEMNGSDCDSRRGLVLDFLRTLKHANPVDAVEAVKRALQKCLSEESDSKMNIDETKKPADQPNEWIKKDVAAALLLAFCPRGWSKIVTKERSQDDPGIQLFLDKVALPELALLDININPSLRADCLRFVCGFRLHMEVEQKSRVALDIARCLQSENSRTRAIAAITLERLLATITVPSQALECAAKEILMLLESLAAGTTTNATTATSGVAETKATEIAPPTKPGASATIRRAAYSASMRVVHVLGKGLTQAGTAEILLPLLASHLRMPACGTNDSLCVLIEALVRRLSKMGAAAEVEKALLPLLLSCMEDDELSESHSSILDVIAAMLDSAPEASPAFIALYPSWVLPKWYKGGRQAALARLLCIYLHKIPALIWANDQAKPLLGVFHKLLGSGSTIAVAMKLLLTVDERLPSTELWAAHGVTLVRLLWARLNQSSTNESEQGLKYARLLGRFVLSHGARRGFGMLQLASEQVAPRSLEVALRDRLLPAISPLTPSTKHPISDAEKAIDITLLTAVLTRTTEPDMKGEGNRSPFVFARNAVLSSSLADATWNDVGALWLNGIAAIVRLCDRSKSDPKEKMSGSLQEAIDNFIRAIAILYQSHSARLGPIFARSLSDGERATFSSLLVRK